MKRWFNVTLVAASVWLIWPHWLLAAVDPRSASTNFSVVEGTLGATGDINATSTNFSQLGIDDGGSTLGDIAVGNSASATFQTNSGTNTTNSPVLSMAVTSGSANLGTLAVGAKSTATATFRVKNYTSYGYSVTIIGTAPTNSGHALTALTTDTASNSTGTVEQFGLNTVLNTTAGVGADPIQVPGSTFSYGVAGDGATGTYGTTRPYTISDKWRFNTGDIIASSPKSSGETDYTMTFLANIMPTTQGGMYTSAMTVVATGQY